MTLGMSGGSSRKEESIMASDVANDKPLFRYLGLLSNEVVQIHKTLGTIDSQESRFRAALDELALEKEILIEQTSRLENIVKQAATSALVEVEQESERQQELEGEKNALQTQVTELEKKLRTGETRVQELQEQFTAQIDELHEQVREKDDALQVRELVLKDLKTAADSLSRLIVGLSPGDERPLVSLDHPAENAPSEAAELIGRIEERASMEIEKLKRDVREKELALAAKSAELEMTRQEMSGKIEALESSLDARKKRKSQRLVSFISDMSGKRLL